MTPEYFEQNLRLAFFLFSHFPAFRRLCFPSRVGNVIKAVNNMLSFICELFEKNQNLSSPLVK